MKLDTSTDGARRQYDANVEFARSYVSRLGPLVAKSARPRVLVTGFGRFMSVADNATGQIVSRLTGVPYPVTAAPAPGAIDPPGPQLAVGVSTLDVPGLGEVDVCAMILPVFWDLAAILVARELDALRPSLLILNGVAGPRQALWLELGAANQASLRLDGSNLLRPYAEAGETLVKVVDDDPATKQPSLLSWRAVEDAVRSALARLGGERDSGEHLGDIVQGVGLAGFPRASNAYLCNDITWITGWLMRHPGREVALLQSSDAPGGVRVRIDADLRTVPRVFVHWPSELVDRHHDAAADLMRAIIIAQLTTTDPPTPGDDRDASEGLRGGAHF